MQHSNPHPQPTPRAGGGGGGGGVGGWGPWGGVGVGVRMLHIMLCILLPVLDHETTPAEFVNLSIFFLSIYYLSLRMLRMPWQGYPTLTTRFDCMLLKMIL